MQQRQRRHSFGAIELDEVDVRMLAILQADGRISKSRLAGEINLSASACFERMQRLERSGVISAYQARIDLLQLGDPQLIQVHVMLESHRSSDFTRFERRIMDEDMIMECFALGGGVDYSLTVWALRISDYQTLLDRLLDSDIGIKRYFTYVITKRIKQTHLGIEDLVRRRISGHLL
ncbi:Lrp/AsnC family transcriptional regulator [Allosediminivita pacifica]|uniref:AsnC family transcriptional regulator n=1 Tax=Allosediminivita pacifica TaxID=1267769 RepID=A0A2T6A016_9RHOB|nr:Lrp/AsnC family transcriptional regulator [Allosediminivita pacifica]PTX37170.1 AsnC family transcriptional regulator [Allosediminivita pacifica]GGB30331.1 AsnC family transcriptional regulator [Allosediminivita pacifica]